MSLTEPLKEMKGTRTRLCLNITILYSQLLNYHSSNTVLLLRDELDKSRWGISIGSIKMSHFTMMEASSSDVLSPRIVMNSKVHSVLKYFLDGVDEGEGWLSHLTPGWWRRINVIVSSLESIMIQFALPETWNRNTWLLCKSGPLEISNWADGRRYIWGFFWIW